MALRAKKVGDKYYPVELYYRVEGLDHGSSGTLIVYVSGYAFDPETGAPMLERTGEKWPEEAAEAVCMDTRSYAFPKPKSEPASFGEAYELLKTLPEFEGAGEV